MTRIIYLSLITAFIINFTSCKKKEIQSSNNTTIEITLENELGEKISGQYIKMFDEETFSIFKKDSNTKALYESLTNADGKAIFTIDNTKLFNQRAAIDLIFVSPEYNDNKFLYKRKTLNINEKTKITIILPCVKETSTFIIENNILKGITDNNLKSIILPPNVKEIANNVFEKSEITEITLNEGLEKIGDKCFLGSKIKKINFPTTLKHIGKAAFSDCMEIEKIDMSKTQIDSISESTFLDSGIKEIALPTNLRKILSESFSGTKKLRNITISESINEIEYRAFYQSGLTNITLPNSLNKIGYMAFADCIYLTKINKTSEEPKHNGIIEIGAFQNCPSLKEAILPDNITRIEGYTFIECKELNKILLPKNLKSIGEQGLRTNYNINTIVFNSNHIPSFANEEGIQTHNVLPFVNNINEIYVPIQSIDEYKRTFTSYSHKIKGY